MLIKRAHELQKIQKHLAHNQHKTNLLSVQAVSRSGKDLGEKYHIDTAVDVKHVKLQLPSDVVCTHCVLQWTYITGEATTRTAKLLNVL